MYQATFMDMITQLDPDIVHKDITMHLSFTLEKRVAITIKNVTTPNSYHYIVNQFRVGKTTAGEATQEVCLVIQDVLDNHIICFINPQEEQYFGPNISLERVSQTQRDEFCHYSQGRTSQYVVLLLQEMVPQELLKSWKGDTCFGGGPRKPGLPLNLKIHLMCYPWLCYDVLTHPDEFTIANNISALPNP
ncbi:hypothetical protein Y1Q_0014469 [Alligator mississippiensis]|uniref:Uncharacterized protein n=1 Tax=Alligator mississippiensis TaxID=8496 RepID=A0A151PCW0_ALLMI|nr:hypothetical protein Y1Q_0014469 [Alligator mississippiensis]